MDDERDVDNEAVNTASKSNKQFFVLTPELCQKLNLSKIKGLSSSNDKCSIKDREGEGMESDANEIVRDDASMGCKYNGAISTKRLEDAKIETTNLCVHDVTLESDKVISKTIIDNENDIETITTSQTNATITPDGRAAISNEKGQSCADQSELEILGNTEDEIYEEIEYIIEEFVEETASNEDSLKNKISNHADTNCHGSEHQAVNGDNPFESSDQNFGKEDTNDIKRKDETESVEAVKTYANKTKEKRNQLEQKRLENDNVDKTDCTSTTKDLLVHKIATVTESLNNNSKNDTKINDLLNETKVLKTRNRSKSSHYCTVNDFETVNARNRSKSMSIDAKSFCPKVISSESLDGFRILKSKNIKILKVANGGGADSCVKKVNPSHASTNNKIRTSKITEGVDDAVKFTEDLNDTVVSIQCLKDVNDQEKLKDADVRSEEKNDCRNSKSSRDELVPLTIQSQQKSDSTEIREYNVKTINDHSNLSNGIEKSKNPSFNDSNRTNGICQEEESKQFKNNQFNSKDDKGSGNNEVLQNATRNTKINAQITRTLRNRSKSINDKINGDKKSKSAKTRSKSYSTTSSKDFAKLIDENSEKPTDKNECEKNNFCNELEKVINAVSRSINNSISVKEIENPTVETNEKLCEGLNLENNITDEFTLENSIEKEVEVEKAARDLPRRSRGRPPKIKTSDSHSVDNESKKETTPKDALVCLQKNCPEREELGTVVSLDKSRETIEIASGNDPVLNKEKNDLPKKRRGRPPKIKTLNPPAMEEEPNQDVLNDSTLENEINNELTEAHGNTVPDEISKAKKETALSTENERRKRPLEATGPLYRNSDSSDSNNTKKRRTRQSVNEASEIESQAAGTSNENSIASSCKEKSSGMKTLDSHATESKQDTISENLLDKETEVGEAVKELPRRSRGRPPKIKAANSCAVKNKPDQDTASEDELDDSVEGAVKESSKKGRGRPPKSKTADSHSVENKSDQEKAPTNTLDHSNLENGIEDEVKVEETVKDLPRKSRGRPPKMKTSDSFIMENKEEKMENKEVAKDLPKRSRGRPPKIKTSDSQSVENEPDTVSKDNYNDLNLENSIEKEVEVEEAAKDLPRRRSRGRPLKIKTSDSQSVENEPSDNEGMSEVPTKRRGRPPKTKTPNSNVESQSEEEMKVKEESDERIAHLPRNRRGRPLKVNRMSSPAVSDKNSETLEETPNSNCLKKARRGRPRKTVAHVDAVNDDNAKVRTRGSEKLNNEKLQTRVTRRSHSENTNHDVLRNKRRVSSSKSDAIDSDEERKKSRQLRGSLKKSKKSISSDSSSDSDFDDDVTSNSQDSLSAESDESDDLDSSDENEKIPQKRRKSSLCTDEPKKRGRPRLNKDEPRKRGRPKLNKDEPKKRGRPRLNKVEDEFVPHHSYLPRNPKNAKSKRSKVDPETETETKPVKCGKCLAKLKRKQWKNHNLFSHNNLAWLEGDEKPDCGSDEASFKRFLGIVLKKRNGMLICENCLITKRSVAGYLSHLMFCGKDEMEAQSLMVTCPGCNAIIKPSTLEFHERQHRLQAEMKKKIELKRMNLEETDEGLKSNKRKAAQKAVVEIAKVAELVKNDKDYLSGKKLKIASFTVQNLVLKPESTRKIPGILSKQWIKDINDNKSANCSQVGCQFSSSSLEELKKHYSSCNFTPEKNFTCKICHFQSCSDDEIIKHVYENHSLDDDSDDPYLSLSDAEESSYSENNEKKPRESKGTTQSLTKSWLYRSSVNSLNRIFKFVFSRGASSSKIHSTAFQWSLDFELKNYRFSLFEEYVPNAFKLLDFQEAIQYVPEHEKSMSVMTKKHGGHGGTSDSTWKNWERFEGQWVEDNPTFFTGGPVWAIAWLPTPTSMTFSNDVSEYIAVSTHPNMNIEYLSGRAYSGKNIIQIWNVGVLRKKTKNVTNPKLAYAIPHDSGTVWCLEWCPSGCYQHDAVPGFVKENDRTRRMGLLAAACSDGNVRVYSLVFPQDLPSSCDNREKASDAINDENRCPVYETEPCLMLVTNVKMYDSKSQTCQVTKLSWSKENGHNIIVAGFSDGYVALWNLSTKSPMLKFKRNNTTVLMPYRHFYAHHQAVTMVNVVLQDNAPRFLATASLDRLYKFWDLEDVTTPKNIFFKKSYITDGAWLNNWYCGLVASDDSLNMGYNYVHSLPLRNYTSKSFNMLPTNSSCYTVSASDFANGVACGTLAGEILAIFPPQLMYIQSMEKIMRRQRLHCVASSVEIVDLQKNKSKESKKDKTDCELMPSTYSDSKDRFGLIFRDRMSNFEKGLYESKTRSTLLNKRLDEVPVEQYPFMSVNRVAWNPNASSFLWLAAGYQNGFIRLIKFKALNESSSIEWNKLLASHVDKIKGSVQVSVNGDS